MSLLDNPKTNRRFLLLLCLGAVVWLGSCAKAWLNWVDEPKQQTKGETP